MKRIKMFFVIMLFVCLPLQGYATQYALLIGIDAYAGLNALDGCVQDVERMQQVLIEKFDFPPANIKTVLNTNATIDGIQTAFETHLLRRAQPEDVVVVYYSGHGSQVPDYSSDEPDDRDETLCPVNFEPYKQHMWLTDDLLREWLSQLPTTAVTVIIDSCFSGEMTRGRGSTKLHVKKLRVKMFNYDLQSPTKSSQDSGSRGNAFDADRKHVLLSASGPGELSHMLAEEDGKKGSVLTSKLIEGLRGSRQTITYDQLMGWVATEVEIYVNSHWHMQQKPQVEGNYYGQQVFSASEQTHRIPTPEKPSVTEHTQNLEVTIRTDKPIYYEGDVMTVFIQANQDCYIRLFVKQADGNVVQLFPNKWEQDNLIRGGARVCIPAPYGGYEFAMTPPFGQETLHVVASPTQFTDQEQQNWRGG